MLEVAGSKVKSASSIAACAAINEAGSCPLSLVYGHLLNVVVVVEETEEQLHSTPQLHEAYIIILSISLNVFKDPLQTCFQNTHMNNVITNT